MYVCVRGVGTNMYVCVRGVGTDMYMCARGVGTDMYVCVRGVDVASVSWNFRLEFETVPKVWYFFVFIISNI